MPKTYRKRKSYGKKPYARPAKRMYRKKLTRAKKGSRLSKIRMGTIIADKAMVKMSWSKKMECASETHLYIRGNSPWDPNYAVEGGTSVHAKGFEFWAGIYGLYRVKASKAILWGNNNTTDDPVTLFIVPTRNSSLPPIGDPESEKYVRYKWLGQKANSRSTGSVKSYMTTAKMFGLKSVGEQDEFTGRTGGGGGPVGTNPVAGWNWAFCIQNTRSPAVTALAADIALRVVYWVEFTLPRTYQSNTAFDDSSDVQGGGTVDGSLARDQDVNPVPP